VEGPDHLERPVQEIIQQLSRDAFKGFGTLQKYFNSLAPIDCDPEPMPDYFRNALEKYAPETLPAPVSAL
jgi:hypothetical protein